MKAVKQLEKDSYLDIFFVIYLAEMNDPLTNHHHGMRSLLNL